MISVKRAKAIATFNHRIRRKDVRRCLLLLGLGIVSWSVPEREWPRTCRLLASVRARFQRQRMKEQNHHISALLGPGGRDQVDGSHPRDLAANECLELLQLLRCHRPDGWQPRVRLVGREHVDQALAGGKGAILWVGTFLFSDLLTKIAFHQAGYDVSHMSHFSHTFGSTPFGVRILNPIRTRVECRYLRERVVIWREGAAAAVEVLADRLRENSLVSITATGTGRRINKVPFLGGALQLAAGAPVLARRMDCPLLPVFTVRKEDGEFVTTVEPALSVPSGSPREQAVDHLLRQYASLMAPYAARWSGQFSGWEEVERCQ
jgi:lauroyl/myristoyl acyltransferase